MKTNIIVEDVPNVPKEVRRPLMRELRRCEKYFPFWVRTLYVYFVTNKEGIQGQAETTTDPQYYSATMRFMPAWLEQADAERHHTVLHEIGHLHHANAFQIARESLTKALEGVGLEIAMAMLKRGFEESAEGFALMIEQVENSR